MAVNNVRHCFLCNNVGFCVETETGLILDSPQSALFFVTSRTAARITLFQRIIERENCADFWWPLTILGTGWVSASAK